MNITIIVEEGRVTDVDLPPGSTADVLTFLDDYLDYEDSDVCRCPMAVGCVAHLHSVYQAENIYY